LFTDIVSVLILLAIAAAYRFLPKYIETRVTAAAKGVVDERVGKALAEHRHELDKQLERHRGLLAREEERYSRDYGLFATKRNEVYAATFGDLEKARGLFGPHFSIIRIGPDFSRKAEADLANFATTDPDVGPGERERLLELLKSSARLDEARELAARLYDQASLRRAHAAFRDFKNTVVLNTLYYSPDVDRLIGEAIGVLARMAAWAFDLDHLERQDWEELGKLLSELAEVAARLRDAMRSEMQAGFRGAE
jgi:hypothetical protein